ncbi:hypothetical protein M6B38_369890 [Iris pallida]|uniref:Uncharacterized protein n=1 Tax=Iris pallida TaxID=29817 RepID=A0AAX6GE71_IRIPA|nr:hypothetical protein M6B38_369890 [Iris pallida]
MERNLENVNSRTAFHARAKAQAYVYVPYAANNETMNGLQQ